MAIKFEPNTAASKGYTKADWEAVSDSPRITKAEITKAKPFGEAFPELQESIKRARGRPRVESPKEAVTLRLDADVIEAFKATGKNWRSKAALALELATSARAEIDRISDVIERMRRDLNAGKIEPQAVRGHEYCISVLVETQERLSSYLAGTEFP